MNQVSTLLLLSLLSLALSQESPSVEELKQEGLKHMVFPESCYKQFHNGIFTTNCVKVSFIRILGYAVVCLATVAKVPQILKVLANGPQGLSMMSLSNESVGYSLMIGYNQHHGYPFSTYGELVFLLIQNLLLLVLFYVFKQAKFIQLASSLGLIAGLLLAFHFRHVPSQFFSYNIMINIALTLFSRVPQIILNFKNESTGALSFITCALFFGGSIARLVTIVSEVSDHMLMALYIISTTCNAMLLLQIVIFWNNKISKKVKQN